MFEELYGNIVIFFPNDGCLGQFELESLRKDFNRINKEVARLKIVSS